MKASVLTQRSQFNLLRLHHTFLSQQMQGTNPGDEDLGMDILLPIANKLCRNCYALTIYCMYFQYHLMCLMRERVYSS